MLPEFIYDLTDRNKGAGQVLDKKRTLYEIAKTNIALGRLRPKKIEPNKFIIGPKDKVFHVLSEEKIYHSQAIVFFARDYSGSMWGSPAEVVSRMHLLIYSWLMYQYKEQVITRFILHDTEAKEVPDFYTYYNSSVAGGTYVESAYTLINQIVEDENLANNYNIYIFHGTDGDDWDESGLDALDALRIMTGYANRIGLTVAKNIQATNKTSFEKYMLNSGILEYDDLIRMDAFVARDVSEARIIEGIKNLIS
jgi:uncharacterized sporulation protein YeaH/YhbH (DUF444 family)